MPIPEEIVVFFIGMGAGAVITLIVLFLIALLYRLDNEHLCADEVDFDFEKKPMEIS